MSYTNVSKVFFYLDLTIGVEAMLSKNLRRKESHSNRKKYLNEKPSETSATCLYGMGDYLYLPEREERL